ncbi:MAG: Co2+/Mg2+ efflux protein ApaG [Gemmatimonadota bacterium]
MFTYRLTEGIRIGALPTYSPAHSDPRAGRYVFTYRICIENVGEHAAQLLSRYWYIHDPVGGDHEVEGEGVVGEQPVLEPGDVHEYESFCILRGAHGHMEGSYLFQRDDGSLFRAEIPRFLLQLH